MVVNCYNISLTMTSPQILDSMVCTSLIYDSNLLIYGSNPLVYGSSSLTTSTATSGSA